MHKKYYSRTRDLIASRTHLVAHTTVFRTSHIGFYTSQGPDLGLRGFTGLTWNKRVVCDPFPSFLPRLKAVLQGRFLFFFCERLGTYHKTADSVGGIGLARRTSQGPSSRGLGHVLPFEHTTASLAGRPLLLECPSGSGRTSK